MVTATVQVAIATEFPYIILLLCMLTYTVICTWMYIRNGLPVSKSIHTPLRYTSEIHFAIMANNFLHIDVNQSLMYTKYHYT